MKLRKFKVAAAVGSLTATVALLAGLSGAQAQAPGGGSFAGSILLPGTNTSFKVGGYAKWDYVYDFSQGQSSEPVNGGFSATALALDGCNSCGVTLNTATGVATGQFVVNPATGGVFLVNPVAAQAGHNVHGGSQMTASESRFNIETRTPTGYGELKTFIEGDFTNPNGLTNSGGLRNTSDSYGFRLRYAYGTLGPVLAGQYNSLFRDSSAEPETLDFGGDPDAGRTRQPQIRYTFDAGNGLSFAGAAETPSTSFESNGITFQNGGSFVNFVNGGFQGGIATPFTTGSLGVPQVDKLPDFTGAIRWDQGWGHVEGRAVVRDLGARANLGTVANPVGGGTVVGATSTPINSGAFGWGLGASGDLHTWGKDDLTLQISGGQGSGSYISSGNNAIQDALVDAFGNIQTIASMSAQIGYQHWWTDTLRSNATGGFVYMWQPNCFGCWAPQTTNVTFSSVATGGVPLFSTVATNYQQAMKYAFTVHANLIWSPVPQVDTGIEYIHGTKKANNGLVGDGDVMQLSTKFKF